jgi:hypothetical protein
VIGTFLTVAFLTLKNRILQAVKRLREPRYLIGGIAGAAYFWFIVFRRAAGAHNGKLLMLKSVTPIVVDCASIVLLLLMILAWALPADSGGLDFTETEIAFLFPAPLRRRDILLYKILRAQPQALFSAFIMTVFGWWRNGLFVGMWAVISVLSVYFTMVSLGRARLRLMHVGFLARLGGVAAIVAGLYGIALSALRSTGFFETTRRWKDFKGAAAFLKTLSAPFQDPLVRTILFIPRLFASAALPSSLSVLAVSVVSLVALGVVFFFIAARLNVSFEEASIANSQKRAARKDRVRSQRAGSFVMFRRAPAPFRLQETGPIEVAVIWKNLIALMRNSIAWVVVFAAIMAFMVGLAVWAHEPVTFNAIGTSLLFMACFFPLMAPTVFANDLRLDMPRLEVLKSYPIAGDRLIAAEIAAPLAVISLLEMMWATSASVLIGMSGATSKVAAFVATPQFIVAVLLLTLPVCAVQLLIRNAVPVLFPAWAMRSKDEPRGFVAMGQRLVTLAGNLIVLVAALIPAAIVFLPSLWIAFRFFAGNAAFVAVATMPAVGVIVAEVWFGVRALGAQFETIDISNESDMSAP